MNEDIRTSWEFSLETIRKNCETFHTNTYPPEASQNQIYKPQAAGTWTEGFWPGQLWLAYLATRDVIYSETALGYLDDFQHRIDNHILIDHHDLGFLYTLSSVLPWRILSNHQGRQLGLIAAKHLIGRYHPKAGIIQAWGDLNDPEQRGRMIVDCTMNMPLLFWAAEETGDKTYFDIACTHVKQSLKYLVRKDNSTFHTYFFDPDTGAPSRGSTHQGYSDDSCWSRGQAWAIYGFALAYGYTKDIEFLEGSLRTAGYFLDNLPQDHVPYWDLIFTEGPEERDSSAAAIGVCGILELAKHLKSLNQVTKAVSLEASAEEILLSLCQNYTAARHPDSNGLLLHGVYNKPKGRGVNEATAWGDYFFTEALSRFAGVKQVIW
jgi:unsaturated chondroitin disaccharide hydrolase